MTKIKLNTTIKNLSNILYQDKLAIDDNKMANQIIKELYKNLKKCYNLINELDNNDYFDTNNANNFEVLDMFDSIDLYKLGDAINLLGALKL